MSAADVAIWAEFANSADPALRAEAQRRLSKATGPTADDVATYVELASCANPAINAAARRWLAKRGVDLPFMRQRVAAVGDAVGLEYATACVLKRAKKARKAAKTRPQAGGELVKVVGGLTLLKAADNLRIVSGVVGDESLDDDGQIADYDWLSSALPAWYRMGGNVRRDHSAKSIGVATKVMPQAAQRRVVVIAKITRPSAIRDLDAGVLKGWSWGARSVPGNPLRIVKDAAAPGGRIVGGEIVEVSLVDRGANRNARIAILNSEVA